MIVQNIDGIGGDIEQILTNHEQNFWTKERGELHKVEAFDNESWYSLMNIIDFRSSVGKILRIGKIRTSVKNARLESEAGQHHGRAGDHLQGGGR